MPINQDSLRNFLFYKNTNLVGDSNMINVHNLIEICHHNDKFCLFYPKNDCDGVQVKQENW